MSITDVLSRISQIQQQLAELSNGSLMQSAATQSSSTSSGAGSAATTSGGSTASTTDFANALAQAQGTSATPGASNTAATTTGVASTGGAPTATGTEGSDAQFTSALQSATGLAGQSQATGAWSSLGALTGGASATSRAALPATASSLLTSNQQQFASTLAADTGLNPGVVSAWLLAEESGSAAQSRQSQHNNDWLNIGYTDGGSYGTSDSIWSDPVNAANATAGWLKGENTIPGYGTAAPGITSILHSVGQTPENQISALQSSGWASSGYPDLPSLYSEVSG